MEQKQLDELDESYLIEEEFIDDDSFLDLEELNKNKDFSKKPVDDDFYIETIDHQPKKEKKTAKKEKPLKEEFLFKEKTTNDPDSPKLSGEAKREFKVEEEKEPLFSFNKEAKKEKKEEPAPSLNPWNDRQPGLFEEVSTWKAITGIIFLLLLFSVFTQGFNFSENLTTAATVGKVISLEKAEEVVLGYVNTNLLQPPFEAEVVMSFEEEGVYGFSLSVAGQVINSYLTKDGKYFFPQGLDTSVKLAVPEISEEDNLNVELEEVNSNEDNSIENSGTEETDSLGLSKVEENNSSETEETGSSLEDNSAKPAINLGKKEFVITAKKWLFSPQTITVNKGDKVVLTIEPEEFDFTFALAELGIEKEVSGVTTVEFVATEAGEFVFSCSSCEEWRGMAGKLVVE